MDIVNNKDPVNFLTELSSYYTYLPPVIQKFICRKIEELTCSNCKNNIVYKEFSCMHRFCIECHSLLENPLLCCCNEGKIAEIIDEKCFNCRVKFKPSIMNCQHLCEVCVLQLLGNGVSQCALCQRELRTFFYSGECSHCKIASKKLFSSCRSHFHCQVCGVLDLKEMTCCDCKEKIDFEKLAVLADFCMDKCMSCQKRILSKFIVNQQCCGESFCVKCVSENRGCRCEQLEARRNEGREILEKSRMLFESFDELKRKVIKK